MSSLAVKSVTACSGIEGVEIEVDWGIEDVSACCCETAMLVGSVVIGGELVKGRNSKESGKEGYFSSCGSSANERRSSGSIMLVSSQVM